MTTLNLTDGTTTVSLNSSGIVTLDTWVPGTPQTDENAIANLGDGDTLGVSTWRNVTETIPLLLTGNAATIAAALQSLEVLLDTARQNRLTWGNRRVFLQVQYAHDSGLWRSEVLAGRVVPSDPARRLSMGSMEVALIVTRRYFWEGAETQLSLSSAGTGTATTGYVTVYNDDDATVNSNWFQVASAEVGGDIPAPLKLEIKNSSGVDRGARAFYLSNYVWTDPTTVDPILSGTTTGTLSNTSEAVTHRWALSLAQLTDFNGQYARMIVAFSTLPKSDTLLRGGLQWGTSTYIDLLVGEQIRASGEVMVDLGAIPIPPGGVAVASSEISLVLRGQAPTGSDSIGVDWVQLMPAGHGLYRQLRAMTLSMVLEANDSVIDDGIDGLLYASVAAGSAPWYRGFHAPLHVWPGRTQRMRVMVQGTSALQAGVTWGIKAWYRARRLTI